MSLSARSDNKTSPVVRNRNGHFPASLSEESGEQTAINERSLILLDSRSLLRECLAQSLISHGLTMKVSAFGSLEEWRKNAGTDASPAAVLFNLGGRRTTDPATGEELSKVAAAFHPIPVLVLADEEDLAQVLRALEAGAQGYIPSSTAIGICIEAVNLALVGGIFIPAKSVMAMRKVIANGTEVPRPLAGMFTPRQEEVVQAVRRGKANKIIAYELNLRESTVKVHIRNIMKKLRATNRTEVAYKLNEMFPN